MKPITQYSANVWHPPGFRVKQWACTRHWKSSFPSKKEILQHVMAEFQTPIILLKCELKTGPH